jgi:3-oxoacyl-[acyl-carrier-protein] synthase-3
MAFDLIQSKAAQSVLVVASDTTTRFLGDADRSTRIVFGDGAAAFLLRPAGDRACGMRLLARAQGCDGSGASLFHLSSPGPSSPGHQSGSVRMDGPALFRFAVETGTNMVGELIQCSGRSASEISRVIFHQANKRILDAIAARTTIPAERWVSNIAEVGNLASASALFASLGAGLVWAGAVLEF